MARWHFPTTPIVSSLSRFLVPKQDPGTKRTILTTLFFLEPFKVSSHARGDEFLRPGYENAYINPASSLGKI